MSFFLQKYFGYDVRLLNLKIFVIVNAGAGAGHLHGKSHGGIGQV